MRWRHNQFWQLFEIDIAQFTNTAVVGPSSDLQETTASVTKPITGMGIAEFLRLVEIAKAIHPLAYSDFITSKSLSLLGGDARGVSFLTKHLAQALRTITQTLTFTGKAIRLVQHLSEEMCQTIWCVDTMFLQQCVSLIECSDVVLLGLRRCTADYINSACHAFSLHLKALRLITFAP
jgi:hypothetical protein